MLKDIVKQAFEKFHLETQYQKLRTFILSEGHTQYNYRFNKQSLELDPTKKNLVLLGVPSFANLGDQAILLAEREFIHDYFSDRALIEVPETEIASVVDYLGKNLHEGDVLTYHGGGNVGTMGLGQEYRRRLVVEKIKFTPIISFPQSVFFGSDYPAELKKSQQAYDNSKNFVLVARENYSYDQAQKLFTNVRLKLTPDIVFYLLKKKDYQLLTNYAPKKVLLVIRDDIEKQVDDSKITQLAKYLKEQDYQLDRTDTTLPGQFLTDENRKKTVDDKLQQFADHDVVITDRLHGVIFSLLKARPVIALKNSNFKIESTIKTWLGDCPLVYFIDDASTDNVAAALEQISKVTPKAVKSWYDRLDFDKLYAPLIKSIKK